MRVGLFGGTFDPPHLGHLAVARAVRDRFALDRVLLAPAAVQPLKPDGAHAGFADRLRMVELLCAGCTNIEASAIDAPRPDGSPNFTIDTLHRLRAVLSAEAEIFVIVGADAFLGIRQWKSPDDLLREAGWIVVSRPGFDLSALDSLGLTPEQRAHVEILRDFANPVSATEIRDRLPESEADDEAATDLVPAKVLEYIKTHHLYGT
ncbi:MAG TPA: nicotinate (nicotinamide) nucleotide adenylyltransferase [Acidobacteriaceae bacterium]|nr:nicotinate (nicotinamide) nucleotide adenylyltransferase [Acidobacteriaceae bacterium]